jgi:anti-sigma B factor antagonist
MLTANLKVNDKKATIVLKGRADTPSSICVKTEFEKGVEQGCTEFEFDLTAVEYVCSATLRTFLVAQKACNASGYSMYLTGANDGVKDVFEITGFSSIIDLS